ncbi:MAG: hypothetical protein JAY90_01570 [Candidatus Thiodiazotropha lotti]|nr:hypothetical protein [Candidatus Thiodiazotropha lotti]
MEREEIINGFEYLSNDEVFLKEIQYRLRDAVSDLDVELIAALVKIGADPNVNPDFQYRERNHGFLHVLTLRYEVDRTLHGSEILNVLEVLLKAGADPNQAGDCNMAPIQRCTSITLMPVKELLLKYNARIDGNPIY